MALNTLKLLDDCDIVAAHVFPFSPRPNTPAARMPQLAASGEGPRGSAPRRGVERRSRWLDGLVGTALQPVLVENDGKGHSGQLRARRHSPGRPRRDGRARITGRDGDHLAAVWA